MNVLIISGSMSYPSHTFSLCQNMNDILLERGCDVNLVDLRQVSLPICNPVYHHDPMSNPNAAAKEFVTKAQQADAFVWGTPNYHNSFSGVLKNALDLLNIQQLKNKPIGLVAHGGGIRSVQPLDQLRIVARGLLGVAIPIQIATCNDDYSLQGSEYQIVESAIQSRIHAFIDQLIYFAEKLS